MGRRQHKGAASGFISPPKLGPQRSSAGPAGAGPGEGTVKPAAFLAPGEPSSQSASQLQTPVTDDAKCVIHLLGVPPGAKTSLSGTGNLVSWVGGELPLPRNKPRPAQGPEPQEHGTRKKKQAQTLPGGTFVSQPPFRPRHPGGDDGREIRRTYSVQHEPRFARLRDKRLQRGTRCRAVRRGPGSYRCSSTARHRPELPRQTATTTLATPDRLCQQRAA